MKAYIYILMLLLLVLGACSNPAEISNDIWLGEATPNPMHYGESTTIPYRGIGDGEWLFTIINSLGQEVLRTSLSSTEGGITWNGLDQHGRQCQEGIYVYRLERGTLSQTNKFLIIK